jgi:hypothetical protein
MPTILGGGGRGKKLEVSQKENDYFVHSQLRLLTKKNNCFAKLF